MTRMRGAMSLSNATSASRRDWFRSLRIQQDQPERVHSHVSQEGPDGGRDHAHDRGRGGDEGEQLHVVREISVVLSAVTREVDQSERHAGNEPGHEGGHRRQHVASPLAIGAQPRDQQHDRDADEEHDRVDARRLERAEEETGDERDAPSRQHAAA